jgi:membrane-associated phospholipid phosphatase
MRFLYWVDRGDNLFPSIHCSMSWLCWLWVRGRKDVPLQWRVLSLVIAVAICISTLTTRQHVFVDIIGGIVLAEVSYALANIPRVRGVYTRFMNRILTTLYADR